MSEILHSKVIGSGQPMCILHGFLGMSDNWKTLANQYSSEGIEVHLIDQRNHGKSFHALDFNYDILSDDLFNYLEHHNIDDILLLGHSMGGKTAMQFACNHNDKVKKLIVADIAPKYYPAHHNVILDGLNAINIKNIPSRKEADIALEEYIPDIGTRQFLLKNLYWKEKGVLDFRFNLEVLSTKMDEIGENIGSTDSFSKPTLFLRGDKSEYITSQDTTTIKTHFNKATVETIDNAGHWLHAENPVQFYQKSIRFIKQGNIQ